MDPTFLLCGVAAVVIVGLHLAGQLGVRRRDRRYAWLIVTPMAVGCFGFLFASVQVFRSAPLFGLLIAAFGVGYLALVVRLGRGVMASLAASPSDPDFEVRTSKPMIDYTLAWYGIVLVAGLVAVAGLIVWGVAQALR